MTNRIDSVFDISSKLDEFKKRDVYRFCPLVQERTNRFIVVNNQKYLNFTSNDYMGLATSDVVVDALKEGIELYKGGTSASPLVTGLVKSYDDIANTIKRITQKEAVICFSSGFAANQAIVKALNKLNADLIFDKYAHASMQDAASYIGEFKRYKHNDIEHAEKLVLKSNSPVILTEGVFSMDGDTAALDKIVALKHKYPNLLLVLDDAHGFGVLGEHGHGTLEHFKLPNSVADVYMGTLSKAIGVSGAFVASSKQFIEYMINTSREYIYSTSNPGTLLHAANKSIEYIESHSELRIHLNSLIKYFKDELAIINPEIASLNKSVTSIQPIILGETAFAMRMANFLKEHGIWIGAMRPPTVPQGTARLRLTITAAHQKEDIDTLLNVLKEGFKSIHD